MCIYCKERCFLLSDIILTNSNPNSKHLQNRNFVYINEREVVQNVKITCAASDIDHKCIWSIEYLYIHKTTKPTCKLSNHRCNIRNSEGKRDVNLESFNFKLET